MQDFFSYIIYDGLDLQSHIGVKRHIVTMNDVTVHVRNCRHFANRLFYGEVRTVHPLCVCAQTETALVANPTACTTARLNTCSLRSNDTSRSVFLYMCLSCEEDGYSSGDCIAETTRAVSMLVQRGMCSTFPAMDCLSESITLPGREAVNYLTIALPQNAISEETFSPLTNAIGAFGRYDWLVYAKPSFVVFVI